MSQQSNAALEFDLADRARDGDGDALTELYQRYQTALLRHAWRMLGDEASAADVVQEAFSRAIMSMPKTRGRPLQFKAWIYRITTNLCLRELTRRSRLTSHPSAAGDELVDEGAEAPDRSHRRRQLASTVQKVLKQLPDRYRQILLLREFDELSYDELAEVLRISVSTVKVTLHRARSRFAALFVTEQLLSDPETISSVKCRQLRRLVELDRKRRLVERHLEQCQQCHAEAREPSRELLMLLPPVPDLNVAPPSATQLSQAAQLGAGTNGLLQATTSKVLFAAAATTAAVAVVATTMMASSNGSTRSHTARSSAEQSAEQSSASAAVSAKEITNAPGEQVDNRPSKRATQLTRHRAGVDRRVKRRAAKPVRTKAKRPSRMPQTVDSEDPDDKKPPATKKTPTTRKTPSAKIKPLKLKLHFAPNTVRVFRAGRSFILTRKTAVARGDRLVSGRAYVALLANHQWVSVRGSLKLLGVERGQPMKVRLETGQLRARASARAAGIQIKYSRSSCKIRRGEMRLKVADGGLQIDAINAHVLVSGPHAARTVPPGSGMLLGHRPEFPRALIARPLRLRPTRHRGQRPPLLRWQAVNGATSYRVMIGRDADFLVPEEQSETAGLQYRPRTKRKGKHFWKVIALYGNKRSTPSKVYSFDLQ